MNKYQIPIENKNKNYFDHEYNIKNISRIQNSNTFENSNLNRFHNN